MIQPGQPAAATIWQPRADGAGRPEPAALAPLRIGLVNNMRGKGFANSDRQFRKALAASGAVLDVQGYAVEGQSGAVPGYREIGAIMADRPDGLIITGAEPATADLRAEPFWATLTRLIDRATSRRIPIMFSCLAAHIAVLHQSGIARQRLARKCHGVFGFSVAVRHPLMHGAPARILVPHSRWNGLDEATLATAGYVILSRSSRAGVDRFVHPDAPGCVFLQGHPEYEAGALLGEYRRDVKRYLSGILSHYPTIPANCCDPALLAGLRAFERQVLANNRGEADARLPPLPPGAAPWRAGSAKFYRNWLESVAAASNRSLLRREE